MEYPDEDELVSIGELNVKDIKIEEEKMEPMNIRSVSIKEPTLLLLVPQRHDDVIPLTQDEAL